MKVSLTQQFMFDASHRLAHLLADHPCHNLHGHTYTVTIEVSGDVDEAIGFLIDYREIHRAVKPLIEQLDHRHLNDVAGLEKPTTEFIARWLWLRLQPSLPNLSAITISETPFTRCTYRGA